MIVFFALNLVNSEKVRIFAFANGEKSVCRKECIFAYSADVKLGHFHARY